MSVRIVLRWCLQHPFALLAVTAAFGMAFPFARRSYSEWDSVYVLAAQQFLAGRDIYPLENGYLYPPFMAWAAIPFTFLSEFGSRIAWYIVNIVCLLLMVRWAWKLSNGGTLDGPQATLRERFIFWLGMAVALRYALDALAHHQTDLVVGAALMGGVLLLSKARSTLAAISFGFAAAIKCTPLLWIPYFLWQRRFLAALAVIGVAIGLNLLPNLASESPNGGWWLHEWVVRYLAPMGTVRHSPGVWGSDVLQNQSVAGAGLRWLMTEISWTANGVQVTSTFEPGRVWQVKFAVYAVDAILLLLGAWSLQRISATVDSMAVARQAGIVFLLMVLLSPMSSKPHFCTMLLPGFCLARDAISSRNRSAWFLLSLAILVGIASFKDLWGTAIAETVLWFGGVTWSALLLFIGICLAMPKASSTNVAQTPVEHSREQAYRPAA